MYDKTEKESLTEKLQRFKKLWRKVKDREDKETIQEQEKSKNWNGEKSEKKKKTRRDKKKEQRREDEQREKLKRQNRHSKKANCWIGGCESQEIKKRKFQNESTQIFKKKKFLNEVEKQEDGEITVSFKKKKPAKTETIKKNVVFWNDRKVCKRRKIKKVQKKDNQIKENLQKKRYIQKGRQKGETKEKQIFKKENKKWECPKADKKKHEKKLFLWSKAERKDKHAKHIQICKKKSNKKGKKIFWNMQKFQEEFLKWRIKKGDKTL